MCTDQVTTQESMMDPRKNNVRDYVWTTDELLDMTLPGFGTVRVGCSDEPSSARIQSQRDPLDSFVDPPI